MTGKLFKKAAVLAVFAAAAGCAAAFPGVDAHSSESHDAAQSLYEVIAAEIAAHREQPEVALALLDQTLARTKSSEVGELAWRTALQTRNPDIVLEQARAWAAIDPKAGLARRTILVNAVEKGRQSEYVELLSRMYADAEDKAELITDVTECIYQDKSSASLVSDILDRMSSAPRSQQTVATRCGCCAWSLGVPLCLAAWTACCWSWPRGRASWRIR